MSVVALVGAQYGSEGKGLIASKIAQHFDIHIRTGAPNAGHTYYLPWKEGDPVEGTGKKVVARSVPIGVINPNSKLVIGPGAMVDLDLLIDEVEALELLGFQVTHRLIVDQRATIIDPNRHHNFEGGTQGEAHKLIGSTGHGVGPARMAHMSRGTMRSGGGVSWLKCDHVGDIAPMKYLEQHDIAVVDTVPIVNSYLQGAFKILLEGTQGSGLSLTHGEWPYVTSTDTNAGQLLVDAGISPGWFSETLLVARTFPIRVAGNSGPLWGETTFERMGWEPEFTTVTKKERRIGFWDEKLFARAVTLNGPDPRVAITFLDYLFPDTAGVTDIEKLDDSCLGWINAIEDNHGVTVDYVGTGPDSVIVMPTARWS